MMGACTLSDVVLVGDARVGYKFTVPLGRVSFSVQHFVFFLSGVFLSFLFWLYPLLKSIILCSVFFLLTFLCFIWLQKKLGSAFQKNKLLSFNLDLTRFGYRGTFLFMPLVLWSCGVSKLRWLI